MGFRFWRRFKIAPGVTLNVSKSGVSVSLGPPGAKFTVGPGGKRVTVGLPGSGMHYTHLFKKDGKPGQAAAPAKAPKAVTKARSPKPADVRAFAVLLEEIRDGREAAALARARGLAQHADVAFVAGILALRLGADTKAEATLAAEAAIWLASADEDDLGDLFDATGETFALELPVSDEVNVILMPDRRGAALARVEALQRLGRIDEALAVLQALQADFPDDALVALSLQDLLEDAA